MTSTEPDYFSGEHLWGNDFTEAQVRQWYAEEEEAYAALGAADRTSYRYEYHSLNRHHGFDRLPRDAHFKRVLGFGSAYGDELLPLAGRMDEVIVVDPSEAFAGRHLAGLPIRHIKASRTGKVELPDASVELVVCFGVLHHIPNVQFVLGELSRVLQPGGWLLVREPVVSMGDWRQPRAGLTRNERGIPHALLRQFVESSGLVVKHHALVDAAPALKLVQKLGVREPFNVDAYVWLDQMLSSALAWNLRYHATRPTHRFRPTSAFVVARKR